jgi:hypothetical protein
MVRHRSVYLLPLLILGVPVVSFATLLDFDTGLITNQAVPNGYGGLDWSNFRGLNADAYVPSGYQTGTITHPFVVINELPPPEDVAAAQSTFSSATPFDFASVYLTAAWNFGMPVLVEGYQGANLIPAYSMTVRLDMTAPTFVDANFAGVNRVVLTVTGPGTPGPAGGGTYFAMDDLTINPVSEPGTLVFLGTGLTSLAMFLRRLRAG